MPTPTGPLALSVALHFSSMTSNACFQLIGWNSPFLSNLPSFMRSNGVVRRSAVYWILARK
jgi:hypothetical protein